MARLNGLSIFRCRCPSPLPSSRADTLLYSTIPPWEDQHGSREAARGRQPRYALRRCVSMMAPLLAASPGDGRTSADLAMATGALASYPPRLPSLWPTPCVWPTPCAWPNPCEVYLPGDLPRSILRSISGLSPVYLCRRSCLGLSPVPRGDCDTSLRS